MLELRCMTNYLWTCCNMWLVCWIMYDLGLYVGWFEILHDTRRTIGFLWAQVWWFDYLDGCYCICALMNWMVLLQSPPLEATDSADPLARFWALQTLSNPLLVSDSSKLPNPFVGWEWIRKREQATTWALVHIVNLIIYICYSWTLRS